MVSLTSEGFINTRDWHRAIVGGKGMILRRTSALEFLELFSGYMNGKEIDVYAKRRYEYENITYCIVDTFDGINYIDSGGVLCTTINQTINDMLADLDSIDEQPLVEALSKYYFTHDKSFTDLTILPENIECFSNLKDWAIEYYNEG